MLIKMRKLGPERSGNLASHQQSWLQPGQASPASQHSQGWTGPRPPAAALEKQPLAADDARDAWSEADIRERSPPVSEALGSWWGGEPKAGRRGAGVGQ